MVFALNSSDLLVYFVNQLKNPHTLQHMKIFACHCGQGCEVSSFQLISSEFFLKFFFLF